MTALQRTQLLAALCCGVFSHAAYAQSGLNLRQAIALALAGSPDIELQRSLEQAGLGQATLARAPFNTVSSAALGSARDQRPLRADEKLRFLTAGPDQLSDLDHLQLGATRLLESGLQIGGAYTLARSADSVQRAQNIPQQTSDRLSFTLRLPLQKNSGREAAATRNAADLEAGAIRRETEHVVARTVLSVTQAYWDWATRINAATVAAGAQERMLQLRRETQKLIEQDELPPAEMNLLQAAVSEREIAGIGARQRSRDARFALARLYGMNESQAEQLALPADALPEEVSSAAALEGLRVQALERRADLAALRLREQAALERLSAARQNNKPVVDLELSAYYAGLRESSRGLPATLDPTARTAGPGLAARIAMQWPPENSANDGALRIAAANAEAARLRRATLEQNILAGVASAYGNYVSVVAQLRASNETVQRYRAALKDTQTRRLLGSATLIDVLNVEDRLNNAILARLQYQQGYATARALILFEAGRLIQGSGENFTVALDKLLP